MNYKKIEMGNDYYKKLLEIACDLYELYESQEYTLDMLDDLALTLFELTSKQFNRDNYMQARYKELKEDITLDLCIRKNQLEKEFSKLHEELQKEYESKFEQFKNDLLKTYKNDQADN